QRWQRYAQRATSMPLQSLRQIRTFAKLLERQVTHFIGVADNRLALPLEGSNAIPRPPQCDWAHRPALWRQAVTPVGRSSAPKQAIITENATLFHDCDVSEITYRQMRNAREEDLAPYGLKVEVFKFDGSFLSVAIDLPQEAVTGLSKDNIIGVNLNYDYERPLDICARLNIKHGPNVEQVVREFSVEDGETYVEFDLSYTKINDKRLEGMWLDLIFDAPDMNQVMIHDLYFVRRPRAAF
ncbi:MAG: DUF6478 family protein, partial [Halocynthiibacter sp.]